MRARLLQVLILFLVVLTSAKIPQSDEIDNLTQYFASGDARKMSVYFSSALELNILSEENVYSRAQAEQIMRDFFSKNKPVSVKVVHKLTSNPNYKLAVLSFVSVSDKFRVSISLNSSGQRFVVKGIRIEYDKQ